MADYEKHEICSFTELGWSEMYVQDLIANDPKILGLGDLRLHDRERRQPSGGRLDLLLKQDGPDDSLRFAVEIQLGPTDPHHILRTIEYWDIEQRRFPQYTYRAVIVAGEITSRYFNVIKIFNQYIPIIAIKMSPVVLGGRHTIVFTKVLDYSPSGTEEEDISASSSAAFDWDRVASKETMDSVEVVAAAAKLASPDIQAKYNKGYVQLKIGNSFFKLLSLWPKRAMLQMELPIEQSEEVEAQLNEANIKFLGYDERRKRYVLMLGPNDASKNKELLTKLIRLALEKGKAEEAE